MLSGVVSPTIRTPVPLETLEFQIRLATVESSDLEFVPSAFRSGNISAAAKKIR
jgi:hypothetical protein